MTVERNDEFLDDLVVGQRVRVVSKGPGYRTESSGVYQGVVRSEWDGEPIHFFTDGEIGGTPQTCFGFPAPGLELTTELTPSAIVRGGETALERAYREGTGCGGLDVDGVRRLVEMSRENAAKP